MDKNAPEYKSFLAATELAKTGVFVKITETGEIEIKPVSLADERKLALAREAKLILGSPGHCFAIVRDEFFAADDYTVGLFGRCKNEDLKRSTREMRDWFWERLCQYYTNGDTVGMVDLVRQYADVCFTNLPKLVARTESEAKAERKPTHGKKEAETKPIPFS